MAALIHPMPEPLKIEVMAWPERVGQKRLDRHPPLQDTSTRMFTN
jgi:hypothetical protein